MDYCMNDEQDQGAIDDDGYFFIDEQDEAITSSSTIARILGVEHPDIMRVIMIIRNSGNAGIACAECFRPSGDLTGKLRYSGTFQVQSMYAVTVEGFSLVVPYFYLVEQWDQEIEEFFEKFSRMNEPLRHLWL